MDEHILCPDPPPSCPKPFPKTNGCFPERLGAGIKHAISEGDREPRASSLWQTPRHLDAFSGCQKQLSSPAIKGFCCLCCMQRALLMRRGGMKGEVLGLNIATEEVKKISKENNLF
jgi:hypothetical protein